MNDCAVQLQELVNAREIESKTIHDLESCVSELSQQNSEKEKEFENLSSAIKNVKKTLVERQEALSQFRHDKATQLAKNKPELEAFEQLLAMKLECCDGTF